MPRLILTTRAFSCGSIIARAAGASDITEAASAIARLSRTSDWSIDARSALPHTMRVA